MTGAWRSVVGGPLRWAQGTVGHPGRPVNWLAAVLGMAAIALALTAPAAPAMPRLAPPPASAVPASSGEPGIDINRLDIAALADALPGIGAALAERIVTYRSLFGPLRSADDLLSLGIPAAVVARVRPLLRFGT